MLLGAAYGLALGLVTSVIYADPGAAVTWHTWQLAATVALAMTSCMIIAALVGGTFPLLFERIGIDPAIAAGPFVTTSVDILGIGAYVVIGRVLLV